MAYFFGKTVVGLALGAAAGCGPAVSGGADQTDGGTLDTDPGTSNGTAGTSTTGATSTDGGSTTGDDTTTGEPAERWCWEPQWAQASGILHLWADGNTALAAAGRNILVDDGSGWTEHQLDLTDLDGGFIDLLGVHRVAARSTDDAWFGGWEVLVHLERGVMSRVALPVDSAEVLDLHVDTDGTLWALLLPPSECTLGPCEDPDTRMFRRDGSQWIEQPDSEWVDDLDLVDDTMWGSAYEGQIARSTGGGAWEFVDTDFEDAILDVVAVSSSEVWTSHHAGTLRRWANGTWTTHLTSPWHLRGWSVGADGTMWAVMNSAADGEHRLRRFDGDGWVDVTTVAPSTSVAAVSADAVVLAPQGDGNFIDRIFGLQTSPSVTHEFARESLGNMHVLLAPEAGAAMGVGLRSVQRLDDGAWTKLVVPEQTFSSLWGNRPSDLWAIDTNSLDLWRVTGDTVSAWPLPEENPQLRRVWGTAEDRVFVVGAPPHPAPGISSSLMVMRWDGTAWTDISPDIDNPGTGSRFDLHGTESDLYVVTPGSLHHYDGTDWESFVSPSFDFELTQVRVSSPQTAFVLATDQKLRVHDGDTWRLASEVWPELAAISEWSAVRGNETAGIYAQYASYEDNTEGVFAFDGVGWEELELPSEMESRPTLAVSADGLELWADDDLRIWHATRCPLDATTG